LRGIKKKKGVGPPPCKDRRALRGSQTLVSLSLRLKDLLGPVTRVKEKKKRRVRPPPCEDRGALRGRQEMLRERGRLRGEKAQTMVAGEGGDVQSPRGGGRGEIFLSSARVEG